MRILKAAQAEQMGFSLDKRKRRRQHRLAAKNLLTNGGVFNGASARGSTFHGVALWHLDQARYL
jgi:hypothetical protein